MNPFFSELMRGVPRGDTSRFLNQQRMPQARWQKPEDVYSNPALMYDPARPGGKILVGALHDRLIGIDDNRHVLTLAGSRAGKSLTLIANLLFYRGSVLATDPKGELARLTAQRREALGQRVHILDPFQYAPERIAHLRSAYNPMAILTLDSKTIIEDANLIAEAIVIQSEGGKDPHWDDSARDFLEGIILHVATCAAHKERANLVTVRDLIQIATAEDPDSEDLVYLLEEEMLENAQALQQDPQTADLGRVIAGAARSFYDKADRERDSVLSTVRRHTKFLDYTALRDVLRGHDFDLADLKRDPAGVTVYLCFPATRMEMAGRWLRIFINQLLDAMERERTEPPVPVLACLDEFPVLGHMRQLENAIGQIASFGVKLWVVAQDLNQIKALYHERAESFIANAGVMQCFGITDVTTAEYIAKKLGRTPVEVGRMGEITLDQASQGMTGATSATELYDLVTADESTRLFARSDPFKRQLLIWGGYNPMILQRVEYFDAESPVYGLFKGLVPDGG